MLIAVKSASTGNVNFGTPLRRVSSALVLSDAGTTSSYMFQGFSLVVFLVVGSESRVRVLQKNDRLYNKQFNSGGGVTSNAFANHCISKWRDGLTKAGKVSPAFILVLVVSSFHSLIYKHRVVFISIFSIFSSLLHFIYVFIYVFI